MMSNLSNTTTIEQIENSFNISGIPYIHVNLRDKSIFLPTINDVGEAFIRLLTNKLNLIEGKDFFNLDTPFKLSSNKIFESKVIKIGSTRFNKETDFLLIAGPCTVENDGSLPIIVKNISEKELSCFRGGAYKPRKSPYSFQGLGGMGLNLLNRYSNDLKIVTELLDIRDIEKVSEKADIIQIGAKNMTNIPLLKELGKIDKPVLLKRGLSSTIDEFLLSADYILSGGNEKVILCERGIRTFENRYRATLDLSSIPIIKKLSHLPIIVDPSHAIGDKEFVSALSKAAMAVGADGLLIEIHSAPECAICDGEQSLTLDQFDKLLDELKVLAPLFNKEIL